jgi:integrase
MLNARTLATRSAKSAGCGSATNQTHSTAEATSFRLVTLGILREHLEEFGTADDGRLFATSTGGVVSAAAVHMIWEDARTLGLTPEQQLSPLAGRPYDLRHAYATRLLNAGVPPKEVARRLGHSVEVLWKVYAGCMDGDEERINRLVEKALDA